MKKINVVIKQGIQLKSNCKESSNKKEIPTVKKVSKEMIIKEPDTLEKDINQKLDKELDKEPEIKYEISNHDLENLIETILEFIDTECLMYLSYPNYEQKVKEQVELFIEEILPDSLVECIEIPYNEIIDYYFTTFHEPRSYSRNLYTGTLDLPATKKQIDILMKKEQPEQKSEEWYKYRHNLITASSAWKIIDSDSNRNQYIYGKCTPINIQKYKSVNINSPFHWGNKYEPLSVSLYEYLYKTKIMDFGCLPHDNHYFIGASPDGINVDETSPLYGRMLEIKNIYNRVINGIPKREYWIQMQIQMEVCNLPECDFLECRFKEYETKEDFYNDGTFEYSLSGKMKGIKVMFHNGQEPIYEYSPFLCKEPEFKEWRKQIMTKNSSITWIKDIYWWLEEYSCVLVSRNKQWFQCVLPNFEEIWKTIEKERQEGYEHRKPKQRNTKQKKHIFETIDKVDNEQLLDCFFGETED